MRCPCISFTYSMLRCRECELSRELNVAAAGVLNPSSTKIKQKNMHACVTPRLGELASSEVDLIVAACRVLDTNFRAWTYHFPFPTTWHILVISICQRLRASCATRNFCWGNRTHLEVNPSAAALAALAIEKERDGENLLIVVHH